MPEYFNIETLDNCLVMHTSAATSKILYNIFYVQLHVVYM